MSNFLYCLFGVFIVSEITILGDVNTYLYRSIQYDIYTFLNSTSFTVFITQSLLKILREPLLVHFFFSFLSFLGIYIPLSKIPFSKNQLITMLIVFSFPSFGTWSNLIGKEALVIFSLGFIVYNFYYFFVYNKFKYKFFVLLSCYIILIIKPQFFLAILSIFLIVKLRTYNHVNRILWVNFLYLIIGIFCFFLLKDIINEFASTFWIFFSGGGTTRPNTWLNDYDFFIQAPLGMLVAFVGPKFSELNNIPNIFAFIESSVIVIYVSYLIKTILFKRSQTRFFSISIAICVLFLILFVHYPFGYFNPGSAIRYRANFLPFIILVLNILILITRQFSPRKKFNNE